MEISHGGLLAIRISESIPFMLRKKILEDVSLFSMVFISCHKRYFKEETHELTLSDYPVQENELFVIDFPKFLIGALWLHCS